MSDLQFQAVQSYIKLNSFKGFIELRENLLKRSDNEVALSFESENKLSKEISWAELNNLVSQLQQAFLSSGIKKGDRIAAWLPNGIEIYAVMLASASIGAVFSSVSPDFGPKGVIDRFGQIKPKILCN